MPAVISKQAGFYKGYLMARASINPREYGVDMERDAFLDLMVEELAGYARGQLTLDELLLRPRAALHFCDTVRQQHGWFDLPDDIILRSIMQRRKNPAD